MIRVSRTFKLDGAFLEEHGFTGEMIESLMPELAVRAHERLGDKLARGVI
jgi:hypothetical protein